MSAALDMARAGLEWTPRAREIDLCADTFAPQRAFVEEAATFATADTGRRAGKSEGIARWLLAIERAKPRAPLLYFTLTRGDAKRIMAEPLKALIAKHDLGLQWRESSQTFQRGGVDRIYLTGCNNQTEIGKMRGSGWGAVAGDEAQNFPAYLKPLVEESLTPALMDYDGAIRLTGTPGPVPVGYFYECTRSPQWAHHKWTPFDNPHVNAKKLLDRVKALRGITEDHPSIQREFFGRWTYDASALVIAWNAARNGYEVPKAPLTDFVIGIDIGFDDADAIAVLGWRPGEPNLYLVEEHVLAKQSITELAERLRELHAKYDPMAMVADTGGLGKKIVDEIRKRTSLAIDAAEKERKLEHIELLNDALRTGRMFARRDSRFAADALLCEWDRSNPEKPKISDRFHSDVIDAVLYAFRRAMHWLHEPAVEPPRAGTPAWMAEEERRMEAMVEESIRNEAGREQEFGSYRA